jgi:hypothetical protein
MMDGGMNARGGYHSGGKVNGNEAFQAHVEESGRKNDDFLQS